ncbi:MAG: undecaprenyl/decaprenyl-phosphate alpha-N-acetylglucosaminyl 1-phosphate transferase [Planctomycetia bacterium]|nr:undecaprenyl/decaprenyl-phosphate alpha-N-acetylglucosaminyl 1-phosphate transferase [Planctomycetia bacterium]
MSPHAGFLLALYFAGITAVASALLTPLCMRLARRWGVVDTPSDRSLHARPVPLLGGLAISGALSLVVWSHITGAAIVRATPDFLEHFTDDLQGPLLGWSGNGFRLAIVFIGGALIAALGLLDDVRGLSVRQRIYPQLAVAAAVVALGIRPELGFLPSWLSYALAVLWLTGITNSFNLIDGADGLAAGLAAIAALLLGTAMLLAGHAASGSLFFAIGGAALGFLPWNWHPAKVFMGSAGSLFLGYTLGATTMVATFMNEGTVWLFPLLIPILAFAVPLYDTASVILIRAGMRASIFAGDRRHFHHRLMQIGFSHRQCVVFMYLLALAFGTSAVLISKSSLLQDVVLLIHSAVLVGVVILMERVVNRVATLPGARERPTDQKPPAEGPDAADRSERASDAVDTRERA